MAVLLRDSIYQALRRAILSCEFPPGQELREQILAEKYHVSRSPVRDSLLRLAQENLVTVLPRQGYRVNPIAVADAEDLFGLRELIEPACAVGASHADDTAVRTLDRFRRFPSAEYGPAHFLQYNHAFHCAIADLAGNARITAVEYGLVEEFDRVVRATLRSYHNRDFPRVLAEHEAIIDAIQAHDADTAHRLARDHILVGRTRVINALRLDAELGNGSVIRSAYEFEEQEGELDECD